ncbi:piggyBac transposable element-derived protein 4-like isoform X2 [Sphaeramia orbicularis]|uniref:piggyBac transposable element-derived protein 4-like isoform X2 n=1 Tax=Sphaeramia orbicularis TaxID=375764 RepID=UPI00117C896F|nr:piggyBac transposable element-derived protein 4-like isoform X2 [Sphaeramia orbicularis]
MLRTSARMKAVPIRFRDADGGNSDSDSDSEISSDENSPPSPEARTSPPKKRGRGRGRRRGCEADGDASRSRSPHRSVAWNTDADPDVSVPEPLRFTPRRTPGAQPPLDAAQSPGEIFFNFFDYEVLTLLCTNTNKYAAQNLEAGKKFVWKEIEPKELRTYLGMLLYMSVCNFPKLTDLWRKNTIFHVPFPATAMTRDRFMTISRNLHISDPAEDAVNDKKRGTEDYDSLQQVRPLLELIRNSCRRSYHPKQHLSVNERMVAIKQHKSTKPTKWGLKFFVLADINGYTVDFTLYTGKSKTTSGKGLAFDVVTTLVDKNHLGSGYILYCDNFYTSPSLFQHLKKQGFGACGTYRRNTAGTPSTEKNALHKKSPRGSIRWIREGDLLFIKWMDCREVSLCSTIHSAYSGDTVLRWRKDAEGHFDRVPVPRPTAVTEFNKYMGGIHLSDQMLGTNSVHRKTTRWNVTVFQHLLDIAVTNSYIIHKELCAGKKQKPKTRQAFQEEVTATLLGVRLDGRIAPPNTGHFPTPTSTVDLEKRHKASVGRRRCTLCKRTTPWKCQECTVALCLQLKRNCFMEFHKEPQNAPLDDPPEEEPTEQPSEQPPEQLQEQLLVEPKEELEEEPIDEPKEKFIEETKEEFIEEPKEEFIVQTL